MRPGTTQRDVAARDLTANVSCFERNSYSCFQCNRFDGFRHVVWRPAGPEKRLGIFGIVDYRSRGEDALEMRFVERYCF